ncbi:PREDICTED: probable 28S ribosomal protein S26, mitochondrial [Vollenhovia emeryi]|uniref:probable 28S ribosomal protein S26, mitochondrial n=1 Tax=Vollenhovia emeryi TaxID=411798 RepID=UPI0005F441D2|nr:PREDICTED: probable 28S ribosomal protein S26, mitochondrial [Vollenhovia emeryi]
MQATRIVKVNALAMNTAGLCETLVPNSVYTQCVRWKRKPIWLPTAKSKLFRVPKRPVIPIEEQEEILRLYNNYRTYMTSFSAFLRQIAKQDEIQSDEAAMRQTEEEDFKERSGINDEWNAEIANIREARLEEMREKRRNLILYSLLKNEQKQEAQKEMVNEWIRKTKVDSVTFITAENVDAAIEECLANVVNHNRALDLDGNWHEGKYPPAPPIDEAQKPAAVEQQS